MHIVVDEKILCAEEAFSTIGQVYPEAGSKIDQETIKNADVLVVRTTTKVNETLLKDSNIKFVATATAGEDHIDKDYLTSRGIGYSSSPGCNSVAVAEYVICTLFRLAKVKAIDLKGKTLGIIGAGNAGTAVKKKAECLGFKCLLNDPPISDLKGDEGYIPLVELLEKSDIITLHVPFTNSGVYKTHHLVNEIAFEKMKTGVVLFNTSRGGVIDESCLRKYRSKLSGLVLDTWENEPNLDFESLDLADIATPHIAGYSLDGKYKATEMAYTAICSHFNLEPSWVSPRIENSKLTELSFEEQSQGLHTLFPLVYDITIDDYNLRQIVSKSDPEAYFRSLRNNYKFRNEFSNYTIQNPKTHQISNSSIFKCLGFSQ